MIVLSEPYWLFLALPLTVALCLWPPPSRLQRVLRVVSVVFVLLALAGLTIRLPSRAGLIVVVADRSASMPEGAENRQMETIKLLQGRMSSADQLAVVSFGQTAGLDRAPSSQPFDRFQFNVERNGSDLAAGLDRALDLIPADAPGRLFVLSDGRWTGRDPAAATARAAARRIAIDYRLLARPPLDDLAIDGLDAPTTVVPGEAFLITAHVHSPRPLTVRYELRERDRLVASGMRQLATGRNRLTFSDVAREGGNQAYQLHVVGSDKDPVEGNNHAKLLIGVSGVKPILHVARSANSGLAGLLKKGGLDIRLKTPDACRWSLEELARYSAVVLENVPAAQLTRHGTEALAGWVSRTGAGLFMTGGRESFANGGYHGSPLASILPLSLDRRDDQNRQSVALVVALDRSGSMASPVSGGQVKMDLANAGAAAALDMLAATDEFGCLAVDTRPHTVVPFGPVTSKGETTAKIRRIQSEGGGIYVYEALEAAAAMISRSRAGVRHIVLFSDAGDSEKPEDYRALLDRLTAAGVTVSVIGMGKATDPDGALLEDIARRGKGRCFFTDKAEELPRLFVQETFVVARKSFLDQATPVAETAELSLIAGAPLGLEVTLGGYNLCQLKREALQGGVTRDEYAAPVVAWWQAGLGRVVCFTGEADGKYAGELPSWRRAGDFYTSLTRWAAGLQGPLPGELLPRLAVRNGVVVVELHLDPDRKKEPFNGLPHAVLLRAEPGQEPLSERRALRWSGPDVLAVEVPLTGAETLLTTLEVPGFAPLTLSPVCLPYSPELRSDNSSSGATTLDQLARSTGGKERIELTGIWADLPRRPRWLALAPWLLALAVVVVLLEVLERRTGLLSRPGRLSVAGRTERQPRRAWFSGWGKPERTPVVVPPPSVEKPAPPPVEQTDMMDALQRARERTRARLD